MVDCMLKSMIAWKIVGWKTLFCSNCSSLGKRLYLFNKKDCTFSTHHWYYDPISCSIEEYFQMMMQSCVENMLKCNREPRMQCSKPLKYGTRRDKKNPKVEYHLLGCSCSSLKHFSARKSESFQIRIPKTLGSIVASSRRESGDDENWWWTFEGLKRRIWRTFKAYSNKIQNGWSSDRQ